MKIINNELIDEIIFKRFTIFCLSLILNVSIAFSSGFQQLKFEHISTLTFNKKFEYRSSIQYKNNITFLTLPESSWKNDFDFQWTVNEKGNILYIFKGLEYLNNTNEFKNIYVYKIDILKNTTKIIKLKDLAPSPFPSGIEILDIYTKKDKIYFLTSGGITVFNEKFKIIDFYIFEDVANIITEKIKNKYEKKINFIPYNHGNQFIIDKDENIYIKDGLSIKKYSYSGKREKFYGGKIYSLSNEYKINSSEEAYSLLLENENGEIFMILFKERDLKNKYLIFNKVEIYNINDRKLLELKMKNRKFYYTGAISNDYIYLITASSLLNNSISYLQGLKINMNGEKLLFNTYEKENSQYYQFKKIIVRRIFKTPYIYIKKDLERLDIFKEIE
ncbi:hypothetical protein XO12_04010 [Marinitoga sp. 1154]|uniref:hypothetical protein n=1 Tax=Marinitoga sp. 1154 TaxID=1643335 RepID=UPI001585D4BC|nr:hypothetical protein [Marinitoga sp. 1154]NUU99305.1 hypothetical protein [Marinitoga sp. 1154]